MENMTCFRENTYCTLVQNIIEHSDIIITLRFPLVSKDNEIIYATGFQQYGLSVNNLDARKTWRSSHSTTILTFSRAKRTVYTRIVQK